MLSPGEDPDFGIGWVGYSMNRLTQDAATLQYYYRKGFSITEIDERTEPQMPHIQNYLPVSRTLDHRHSRPNMGASENPHLTKLSSVQHA